MSSNLTGTIYIRDNEWFKQKNIIKLGITQNIYDRENTYITGEPKKGVFIMVILVQLEILNIIDKLLKQHFIDYNILNDGGNEFYKRDIIDLLIPYIDTLGIYYKVLTKEEIYNVKSFYTSLSTQSTPFLDEEQLLKKLEKYQIKKEEKIIKPQSHQKEVLDNIELFYKENDIGKLIWSCGLGKTILSILICKKLNFKRILIGVPSVNLQNQVKKEILKIYSNEDNILQVGGDGIFDIVKIREFLNNENYNEPKFIITTYHSCNLLENISFDFKIADEAHHLVGNYERIEKGFLVFHKIQSLKTLFMTATEKIIENINFQKIVYSMNDEFIFGKYIDKKNVMWAIENKKITDYKISVLKNTEQQVDDIIRKLKIKIINKDLFISCYMTLKSIIDYQGLTHLLLYTNSTKNAELANWYINKIIDLKILYLKKELNHIEYNNINSNIQYEECKEIDEETEFTPNIKLQNKKEYYIELLLQYQNLRENLYNKALHSNNKKCDLKDEILNFKNSKYGIISCVYIFGEGFDLPKLNGVCIAENMYSEIRIVQYLLRPNRLEKENPNKKSYIIIPYIDKDDWNEKNNSFEKVRNIIYQLRNVDENIEQKITLSTLCKTYNEKRKDKEDEEYDYYEDFLDEDENELQKIKMRLRYSKTLKTNNREEQDEYDLVRSINITLNIRSKYEYAELKNKHPYFINEPEKYFMKSGVWKNWYHFMGCDTSKYIKSYEEWLRFCKEKNIRSVEDYNKACEIYEELPKEPKDFYKGFSNLLNEIKKIFISRR